jgi:predicted nucleic acid-binding protein
MSDATLLLNGREHDVESNRVLKLADLSGCTAYDCEFVHVAEKLRLPLVTSDRQILRSFPGIAISMQDFSSSNS